MSNRYTYCFIRKDLPFVQQIVQTAHAIDRMSLRLDHYEESANLILFEVPNERELISIAKYLQTNKIEFEMFFEPDYDTGYTAIATAPQEGEQRLFFKDFNLYTSDFESAETISRRKNVEIA